MINICFHFLILYFTYRSSHWRCSLTKRVLRNLAKFTGKHLWWLLLYISVNDMYNVHQLTSLALATKLFDFVSMFQIYVINFGNKVKCVFLFIVMVWANKQNSFSIALWLQNLQFFFMLRLYYIIFLLTS